MKEAMRRHFPAGEYSIYRHRPFHRRAACVHDVPARAEHRRRHRGRELAVRLHPGSSSTTGRARSARSRASSASTNEAGAAHRPVQRALYPHLARPCALCGAGGARPGGPEGADAAALADGGDPRLVGHAPRRARSSRPNTSSPTTSRHRWKPRRARARSGSKLSGDDTEELVKHYTGFPFPLTGAGAKPVPPVHFCIAKDSRDHSPEVYREVVLPMFAKYRSGAAGAAHATRRRRPHLQQGRGGAAARHRAAGGGVLRAGDPGGIFPGVAVAKLAHTCLSRMATRIVQRALPQPYEGRRAAVSN